MVSLRRNQVVNISEFSTLERNDKNVNQLSKDVSAFANSAGGVIIYGIKEDSLNKHLPIELDPIDRVQTSKEWVEQVLQGNIQPRLNNISIYPVEIDKDVNKVVYVIDIPQSSTAHQANDKKYYKRFNFNSEAMHDYEIRDILNRVSHPKIHLDFEVHTYNGGDEHFLHVYATNTGAVLANYIQCYITVPSSCIEAGFLEDNNGWLVFKGDNAVREIIDHYPVIKYGSSRFVPLLPRLRTQLNTQSINLTKRFRDGNDSFSYMVYADNAEPVSDDILFRSIEVYNS